MPETYCTVSHRHIKHRSVGSPHSIRQVGNVWEQSAPLQDSKVRTDSENKVRQTGEREDHHIELEQ
jgi:hypothetical protein